MTYSPIQYQRGDQASAIRELAEYGRKRKAEVGEERVFDFSLGAPSLPPPHELSHVLLHLIAHTPAEKLHNYTSSTGDAQIRQAVTYYIEDQYACRQDPNHIYLCMGAAAGLCASFTGLTEREQGDEFLVFSPYFPEYKLFLEQAGAKLLVSACQEGTFQPDLQDFEAKINEKTKGVIINQPCNPTGIVFDPDKLEGLCQILKKKEKEYQHAIYLISDEPYRDLVYEKELPYFPDLYPDTVIIYSFSKVLSLAGERIGYIQVPDGMDDADGVFKAIAGAARALGYVCAPSLFQYMLPHILGMTADFNVYRENRDLLCDSLSKCGFQLVHPDGAFYLFIKAPDGNAQTFSEAAKKRDILLVPSDSFGYPGWVRLAYCVSQKIVLNSIPAFIRLAEDTGLL